MNQFSILEGFGSDDINEFVKKPNSDEAKKGTAQNQAQLQARRAAASTGVKQKQTRKPTSNGNRTSGQPTTEGSRKDVRERSNQNRPYDRSRVQPRRGRMFDRNTAFGKGSRVAKKGGAGRHNWGTPGDQPENRVTEEVQQPATPVTTEQSEPVEEQPEETKQPAQEQPQEPEEKVVTYEEYLKQRKNPNLGIQKQQERVKVDNENLDPQLKQQKVTVVTKKDEGFALSQKKNINKSRKKKKNTLDIGELLADAEPQAQQQQQQQQQRPPRNFDGERRGGRGGHWGGRGNRGGRGGKGGRGFGGRRRSEQPAPNTKSQAEFPSLA